MNFKILNRKLIAKYFLNVLSYTYFGLRTEIIIASCQKTFFMFTFDTQRSAKNVRGREPVRFCSRKIKGKLLNIRNPFNLSILVIYENNIELQGYQQPSG